MKTTSKSAVPQRRRAIELYVRDTPFRQKVVALKTRYTRRAKHPNREHV